MSVFWCDWAKYQVFYYAEEKDPVAVDQSSDISARIVNGAPMVLGVRQLLGEWTAFRIGGSEATIDFSSAEITADECLRVEFDYWFGALSKKLSGGGVELGKRKILSKV